MTITTCQRRPTTFDLLIVDRSFELDVHAVCEQALVTEYRHPRPYALVMLDYQGAPRLFAVPHRSNIRWDTPSKWFLATPKRNTTHPGNHAGFDLRKMIPVYPGVISRYQVKGEPLPAQFTLSRSYGLLRRKAQDYLGDYEHDKRPARLREDHLVDIDAVIDGVLPRFVNAA